MQITFKVDQVTAMKAGIDTAGPVKRLDVTPSAMLPADRELLAKYLASDLSVRWNVADAMTTVVVAGETMELLLAKLKTGKP